MTEVQSSKWEGVERRTEGDQGTLTHPVDLTHLHRIASKITAGQELPQVLASLAQVASEETGSDMAAIFLLRGDRGDMRLSASLGVPELLMDAWQDTRLGQGVWGQAAITGRVTIVEDYAKASIVADDPTGHGDAGIHSAWALPLMGRDNQTIGSFAMFFRTPGRPRRQEVFMAQLYGFHASMAIDNARLHEQLKLQAIKDGKTGLFTHDHFLELFELEIDRAQRYKSQLSYLMIDIDDFKIYNDSYGHLTGDRALGIIGNCMKRIARSTDVTARYGGEEFAMVLPDTPTDGGFLAGERLRREVELTNFPGHDGGLTANLSLSIGLSTFPHDGTGVDALIEFADRGLYLAKDAGKNQVVRADSRPS